MLHFAGDGVNRTLGQTCFLQSSLYTTTTHRNEALFVEFQLDSYLEQSRYEQLASISNGANSHSPRVLRYLRSAGDPKGTRSRHLYRTTAVIGYSFRAISSSPRSTSETASGFGETVVFGTVLFITMWHSGDKYPNTEVGVFVSCAGQLHMSAWSTIWRGLLR